MLTRLQLRRQIFEADEHSFTGLALEVFRYQYENNAVYHRFCELSGIEPEQVTSLEQIPYLPIELFKTHRIITGNLPVEKVFTSSGTTGPQTSSHHVCDLKLYEESFSKCFKNFFGDIAQYCLLALLPSYLERNNSSLVYMVDFLVKKTRHSGSEFFMYDHAALNERLLNLEKKHQPTLLIGVTFALLDFAEKFYFPLHHTKIIETGGMKGRREEITREALHETLQKNFGVRNIFSEYGMTELLSQAYYMEDGKFHHPAWMKILVRDVNDPLQVIGGNMTGGINVIDLANLDSCSFIATADLGKTFAGGGFEVLGRMDYSDVRGCNLMWD